MLFSSSFVKAKTVSDPSRLASFNISSSNASPLMTIDEDSSLALSALFFFQLFLLSHLQSFF